MTSLFANLVSAAIQVRQRDLPIRECVKVVLQLRRHRRADRSQAESAGSPSGCLPWRFRHNAIGRADVLSCARAGQNSQFARVLIEADILWVHSLAC